jgi:UDP-GlcNAc:undecaprenyl-phosphate GlcNAc-1-phosphate transferase
LSPDSTVNKSAAVSQTTDTLIVVGVASGGTLLLTPLVRVLAFRIGAVVEPDERRVHLKPTPTLGGTAMFASFLVAFAVASRLETFRDVFESSSEPLGIVVAASVIFLVGAVDDLRPVSPPAKMAGQVLAASLLYLLGVTLFYVRVPFGGLWALSPDLVPLITVLWVVVMANAINFIDGLDGLAAGIVAIAAASFYLYSQQLIDAGVLASSNVGPLIALVALGCCLGFLPHNFHPARIFMGDSGALFLGLLMAASTMTTGGRVVDQFSGQTYFFFAPMLIPFVLLGVPILDAAWSVLRRARRRIPLSQADKGHLHHRLMRLGHGHRRSVLILWNWTALLSGVVLFPTVTGNGDAVVPILVGGLGLALYTMFHTGRRGSVGAEVTQN